MSLNSFVTLTSLARRRSTTRLMEGSLKRIPLVLER
ncbi:hypothetical protein NC652_024156 [Populus alba x Populus x berolinensis]|nr:hypothetical protein NC652_024156 [Populus alba x Populus x berolinensis]